MIYLFSSIHRFRKTSLCKCFSMLTGLSLSKKNLGVMGFASTCKSGTYSFHSKFSYSDFVSCKKRKSK